MAPGSNQGRGDRTETDMTEDGATDSNPNQNQSQDEAYSTRDPWADAVGRWTVHADGGRPPEPTQPSSSDAHSPRAELGVFVPETVIVEFLDGNPLYYHDPAAYTAHPEDELMKRERARELADACPFCLGDTPGECAGERGE